MSTRGGVGQARAASSTYSVPVAFTRNTSAGSVHERPTWVSAARW